MQDRQGSVTAVAAGTRSGPAAPLLGPWLVLCCVMVAAMVVLGGATRLTESGLSIVDWRPVTGILPPLDDTQWQALFDAYRQTPEFKRANFWMTLADFKTIYWLEYLHRLWGRLIGLVFLVPLVWFVIRRQIDRALAIRLGGLFLLGGLQGLMGWYMVKSGLVNQPAVSQYRLAAHLVLAFVIYGALLWLALRCFRPRQDGARRRSVRFRGHAVILLAWMLLTVTAGAFVAGLDAGLAYNTFPKMDGRWIPEGVMRLDPWWINFFENTALVQFTHRVLGIGLLAVAIWLWLRVRVGGAVTRTRRLAELLAAVVTLQAALGVATLLSEVPVSLGVAHQAGALASFTVAIWLVYELDAGPPAAAGARPPNRTAPSR